MGSGFSFSFAGLLLHIEQLHVRANRPINADTRKKQQAFANHVTV